MSVGDRDRIGSSYLLGATIGRGASGVVYQATHPGTGAGLAIKVLHPHLLSDAKATSRFIQERHVLSRISHPNVVRVLELIADGDQISIVMELVEGGDLKHYLNGARLPAPEAVRIAVALADGLAAMHHAGVVHRDLKPANVLMDRRPGVPVPKITDFGLSRLVEDGMTQSSAAVGTPLYMAPEAVERAATTGPPADVYALGIVLFEMLVGETPFRTGGTMAILRAHSEQPPPVLVGVPQPLQALVAAMLAKDPAARPSAVQARDRLVDLAPLVSPADVVQAAVPGAAAGWYRSETVTQAAAPMAADRGYGSEAMTRAAAPGVADRGLGSEMLTQAAAPASRSRVLEPAAPASTGPRPGGPAPGLAPVGGALGSASPGPRPVRRRRRGLVAGVVAAVAVLAVGVVGVLALRGDDAPEAVPLEYAFTPESLVDDVIVSRHWTMTADGSHLAAEVSLTNSGGGSVSLDYGEVLPPSLGVALTDVSFDPAPSETRPDELAAVHRIADLAPQGQFSFTYETDLPPGEATAERLAGLAADQVAAQRAWYEANDEVAPVALELRSLAVAPADVTLTVGESRELVVTGEMVDGTPAPAAALGAIAWTSGSPTVAVMDGARVTALEPGQATVTAQIGAIRASTTVVVESPVEIAAGPSTSSAASADSAGGGSGPERTVTTVGSSVGSGPTSAASGTTTTTSGSSSSSTPTPVRVPSAPSSVTAALTDTPSELKVSWSEAAANGSPVLEYELRPVGQSARTVGAATRSLVVPGLSYATSYQFEVRARNDGGWGEWSVASAAVKTPHAPGRPEVTAMTAGSITDTSARVSFSTSTCTAATYRTNDAAVSWVSQGWPDARYELVNCWFSHYHVFTNLKPDTTYSVTVELRDTAGAAYFLPAYEFTTSPDPTAATGPTTTR